MKLPAKIAFFLIAFTSFYSQSYAQVDSLQWLYFHYKSDGTRGAGPGTSGTFVNVDIRLGNEDEIGTMRTYFITEDSTFSYRRTSSNGQKTKTYYPMAGFTSTNYTQGELWTKDAWNPNRFMMNYRLLFPRNYDSNPNVEGGYPMIVMMHGFGERGNCWGSSCYWSNGNWNPNSNNPAAPWNNNSLLNNDHSMTHGGAVHQTAIRTTTPAGMVPSDPNMPPRAFPGFMFYAQNLNGWGEPNSAENVVRIIRLLIKKYNINPNKIYIHGLSDGGAAVYRVFRSAPWLFAGALPMSAVNGAETTEYKMYPYIESIPLWIFQGGQDGNPTPKNTKERVQNFQNNGMSVRYTLYPTLGHGTWNAAYAEPDFFTWMMEKDKANIHVKFNNPTVCSTSGTAAQLILAQGFLAYQWEKDGELISGATSYSYSATLPGTYRARFGRKANPGESEWNRWSDPVVVTESASAKPTIETLGSTIFPTINSDQTVVLTAGEKNDKYYWFKNGSPVDDARSLGGVWLGIPPDTLSMLMRDSWSISQFGNYTLRTANISGCQSLSSNPTFFGFNANPTLTAPDDFSGTAQNGSSIFLSWTDNSPNEIGFEIWRRKAGETTFALIALTAEDAVSYLDTNLTAGTTYHYKLRAIGNTTITARSDYAPSNDVNVDGTGSLVVPTLGDVTPPTPPQNLIVTLNSINSISLSWGAGTDNNGIKRYKVNYGGSSVLTISPSTTYTITALPINTAYPITVQTEDFNNNLSPPSNQVIGTTFVEGLYYEHSTGAWKSLDPIISASNTPTAADNPVIDWVSAEFKGKILGFEQYSGTNIRNLSTQEEFFKFKFDGYLNITVAGDGDNYQFSTTSDDGSMLFIDGFDPNDVRNTTNNFRKVNNDGLHGSVTVASVDVQVPIGYHRIVVLFNEYTGGQSLTVQYRRKTGTSSYTSWANIPNSMLRSGVYTPPTPPNAPTTLLASAAAPPNDMTSIYLTWAYSGDPAEFEVYRSLTAAGTFEVVGHATGSPFIDNTVNPGTTYFYKLKSVNNNGTSDLSIVSNGATTAVDGQAPSIPAGLTEISKTFSNVVFSWTAATDNVGVTGYQILVAGVAIDTTTITSYMATNLAPGTQYSFTVKAFDASGINISDASSALLVTTNSGQLFYSKPAGALNLTTTWGINTDGTGTAPGSLANNGQIYRVTRSNTVLGGPLTIGGNVSKIIVSDGKTFTVDNTISAKIEVEGNGIVNLNNATTAPEFLSVSPTSTVNFNSYAYVPAGTYGHVNLTGTGNKNFGAGEIVIKGNLTATTGIALKGVPGNGSHVTIEGDITLVGAPGIVATDNALDLTFAKTGTQTVTLAGSLDLFKITTSAATNVNFVNGGSAVTLNVGSPNGGGLSIATGTTLNLGNNHLVMKNAGTINAAAQTGKLAINGSNLNLTSTGTQNSNVYFDATLKTAGMVTSNFSSTGKLIIQSPLLITDGLKIKAGEFRSSDPLQPLLPGNVTLVSTSAKTAYLQEIEGNGIVTGNMNVQRWISITRKYRYMSSVTANMKVSDWQLTMPITGNFTGHNTNAIAASMFYYVENATATGDYLPYPASGSNNTVEFAKGRGYSIFNFNGNAPVTLVMKGNPYQGSVPYTPLLTPGTGSILNGGDGWNLVGNPYASAIQWSNLASEWSRSGVTAFAYVPDNTDYANMGTQFKTYDAASGGIIAPGQAFWVKTTTGTPSMTVHEKAKRTNASTFYREGETTSNSITMRLSNGIAEDEAYVILGENYTDSYEPEADGMKRKNDKLNLSTRSIENVSLVFNKLSDSFCEKTIGVNIEDVAPGSYSLSFANISNLVGIGSVKLTDHFLGTTISVNDSDLYAFAVTTEATSFGTGRFTLAITRPELLKNAIATVADQCGGITTPIQLTNTQVGVSYFVTKANETNPLTEEVIGTGGDITLDVPVSALQAGVNSVVIHTGFKGCTYEVLSESALTFTYTPTQVVTVDQHFYSICQGTPLTLKAETIAGSTFRWYENDVLLTGETTATLSTDLIKSTTTYKVAAVTANGCEGPKSTIFVEATNVPAPLVVFDGQALTLTEPLAANIFVQWYKDQQPLEVYEHYIQPKEEGLYTILLSDKGCSKISDAFTWLVTGIEPEPGTQTFAAYVYPNPATYENLYVKIETPSTQDAEIVITNLTGQRVFDTTLSGARVNGVHKLNVAQDTAPGLYIIQVRQGEAIIQRKVILRFE